MDEHGSKRLPPKNPRRQCADKGSVYFAKPDFNQIAVMLNRPQNSPTQTASDTAEGMMYINTEEEVCIEIGGIY